MGVTFVHSASPKGDDRATPHPGEEKGREGPSQEDPGCLVPQLSAAGREAGRGWAPLSAQREWASGGVSLQPRSRRKALTQQQHVLPGRELGARACGDLAEDAGPNREQGAG